MTGYIRIQTVLVTISSTVSIETMAGGLVRALVNCELHLERFESVRIFTFLTF